MGAADIYVRRNRNEMKVRGNCGGGGRRTLYKCVVRLSNMNIKVVLVVIDVTVYSFFFYLPVYLFIYLFFLSSLSMFVRSCCHE